MQGQMERLRNELRSSLSLLTEILSDFHFFIIYICLAFKFIIIFTYFYPCICLLIHSLNSYGVPNICQVLSEISWIQRWVKMDEFPTS